MGLALTACNPGGGGDAATTPSASTSDEPTDGPTGEETGGGDGGSAGGDLTAWAAELCGVLRPIQEAMISGGATPPDMTDPEAILESTAEQFGTYAGLFRDAATGVESVGAPPVENGDQILDDMINILTNGADALQAAADEVETLDPNDPESMAQLSETMSSFGDEIEESADRLEAAFADEELASVFDTEPACADMDMSG
jgi:hypothetical protein